MNQPLLDPKRDILVELVLKQVMGVLIERLPWLSWGPISFIISFFTKKLLHIILDKTILGINLSLIKLRNDADVRRFNKALDELVNSPDADKEKHRNEVIEIARDLIKLNPNSQL